MIHRYFLEGQDAYQEGGTPEKDNPYTPGSEPHRSWERGWYDAWYAEAEL